MENLTLGGFKQGMKSELRKVVKNHLLSMYPSPIEILETIDDSSLDWTDDGGEFSAKFVNLQGHTILKNEFSGDSGEKVLPLLETISHIDHYLSEEGYTKGYFLIEASSPTLKRGHEYWSEIVSKIVLRLSNEYDVKIASNSDFTQQTFRSAQYLCLRVEKPTVGNIICESKTSSGIRSIPIPFDKLQLELSKITKLTFKLIISKKTKT